jgi:hypothetical protein
LTGPKGDANANLAACLIITLHIAFPVLQGTRFRSAALPPPRTRPDSSRSSISCVFFFCTSPSANELGLGADVRPYDRKPAHSRYRKWVPPSGECRAPKLNFHRRSAASSTFGFFACQPTGGITSCHYFINFTVTVGSGLDWNACAGHFSCYRKVAAKSMP